MPSARERVLSYEAKSGERLVVGEVRDLSYHKIRVVIIGPKMGLDPVENGVKLTIINGFALG